MSEYTNCTIVNKVKYCLIEEGRYIVGDNSTDISNGVEKGTLLNYLIIPKTMNECEITDIGQFSFHSQSSLASVQINANIKYIHYLAFYMTPKLLYINIPSTTEFIGRGAISFKELNESTSCGTATVVFDYPSSIKFIDSWGIERKENMIIYFFGRKAPIFKGGCFAGATSKTVFSLEKMNFDGVKATLYSIRPTIKNNRLVPCYIFIMICLLINRVS